MMPDTATAEVEKIEVTQADRDAAAKLRQEGWTAASARIFEEIAAEAFARHRIAALAHLKAPQPYVKVEGEVLTDEVQALREEVDRFRRPSSRNLSTSDPITPLPTFEPQHLLGLALLFREWCHSDLWGRPNEAELAARQVETAYHLITKSALSAPKGDVAAVVGDEP